MSFDTLMKKEFLFGCAGLALVGVALAQVEASSSTYFIDVDPARYNGPPAQRIVMQVGDQPRHITLNSKDEICVQLRRSSDSSIISAHVRVLRPEPHDAAEVKVAGPGISPGTYRSTPWGMLLRVVPEKKLTLEPAQSTLGTADAPVCSL
jgi:hypothetical protein